MKKYFSIFIALFFCFDAPGQETETKSRYIGVNALQLLSTQLNVNYSVEVFPFFTPYIEAGYGINVKDASLWPPLCKWGNNGYEIDRISGPYAKIGAFFNLRRSFQKNNYLHFGIFFNNSVVSEKGILDSYWTDREPIRHTIYIAALSVSLGYRFRMGKRFRSSVNFQLSLPGITWRDLYGYENYIPGMGGKNDDKYFFPMLIWNVQYKIK